MVYLFSTNRFSFGGHSEQVFGESFAGLSYLLGEDLRFLHLGVFSLKVGVAVWLVCNLGGPSYVVGGDLHCLHLGVLSLEVGGVV